MVPQSDIRWWEEGRHDGFLLPGPVVPEDVSIDVQAVHSQIVVDKLQAGKGA